MTAFSLRLTRGANAVSHLHARDGRMRPGAASSTIPILGITNGIHGPTWIGSPIAELLEDLGADLDDLDASTEGGRFWERLERIPGRELWDAHLRQKRELAHFARGRLRSQFARHGEAPSVLAELEDCARPRRPDDRLRPTLRDLQAGGPAVQRHRAPCARMLRDEKRPVQIVFAGKAHPADRPGQRVIQEIFQRSRSPQLRGRVYILEDYDMQVGRFLVQGVDVWLNNPRRPLEASGTSGMKAAQNGVPNVSVLDGWWDEGYEGDNGWAIGGSRDRPGRGRPGLARRAGPVPAPRGGDRPALLRARRATACRRAGWRSCAGRWRPPCGASRRHGCSTSTPSCSTCRRPAWPSQSAEIAPPVTEAG